MNGKNTINVWSSHDGRWIESIENLSFAIAIVPEGFQQEFYFLWETVGITNSLCVMDQGGQYNLSVGWMVVGHGVQIQTDVRVCECVCARFLYTVCPREPSGFL
jgi:hypothetical protein